MNNTRHRFIICLTGILAIFIAHLETHGCQGTKCQVTIDCTKSMVMAKAVPRVGVHPQFQGLPFNLFLICGNNCGGSCSNPPVAVSATTTMTLRPVLPPTNPTITVTTNLNPVPTCSSNGTINGYFVNFPTPVPLGVYDVLGSTAVTFSDGMRLTASGDAKLCIVGPSPGDPNVPELDVQILSEPLARKFPSDQENVPFRISNNGLEPLRITLSAKSDQISIRPEGGDESQGVYALSAPEGDDFPIQFNPTGCVQLPGHPYSQHVIQTPSFTLNPGQSVDRTLGIRSWGQCADGSCSEYWISAEATRPDGEKLFGCASGALWVDSSAPRGACTGQHRLPFLRQPFSANPSWDINGNGIPDLIEIESGAVPDRNKNLIPDVAEYSAALQYLDGAIGNGVNKLTGDPRFPGGMGFFDWMGGLEVTDAGVDSGFCFEGVFVPRRTGNHRFHIASDDQSEFWLSTDEDPANKVLVAAEPQWTNYREYTGNAGGRRPPNANNTLPNVSDAIRLVSNKLYWIKVLQKQGIGGNHVSAAVQEPGGPPVVNGQAPIGAGLTFPYFKPPLLSGIDIQVGTESNFTVEIDENPPPVIRVLEHRTITLTPMVTGSAPLDFTCTTNGVTHSFGRYPFSPTIQLGEAPANYFLTMNVENLLSSLSRTVAIEVEQDVELPQVNRAYWTTYDGGSTSVLLEFREGIQSVGATNFEVQNATGENLEILAAGFTGQTRRMVAVKLASPTDLTGGAVVLRGIKDVAGNELPPTRFDLMERLNWTLSPIGLPLSGDPLVSVGEDTVEITAGGGDVWGSSDQCLFIYTAPTTGDFDLQVRVDGMIASGQHAKAGLMVRESTNANSRTIFNCHKPSGPTLNRQLLEYGSNEIEAAARRTTGGQMASIGTLYSPPAAFPNPHIRLQREGNVFRGYHSANGMDWKQHAETTLPLPNQVLVGLFAVSQNANFQTTARFSNFGPVGHTTVVFDTNQLRETGVASWSPKAGQAYVAETVTGPFRPLASKKQPIALKPTKAKRFYQVGPVKDGKGAISGRLTDDNGGSLSNIFVRVGEGHQQLSGTDGRFTFGRVAEGENELHITKEVVDETGKTNRLTVTVNVFVPPNVNVPVNLQLAGTNGPAAQPNCPCTPWAMVTAGNINGVQTVIVAGGKFGFCNEAAVVHLGRPSATDLPGCEESVFPGMWVCPLVPELSHSYGSAPDGIWTITAEVCGRAVQWSVEIP
jgi:regulation of enolase protein 1 (concanavalin A-like superfamily)